MVQKTSLIAMVVGLLVASSFVGAAAFTSASVDRSASIDVVSDSNGIIGLNAGPSSVITENDGKLSIDTAVGTASGINTDATMEIGDTANPTSTPAFSVTNNAGSSKTFEFTYTVSGTDSSGDGDVTFTVYDDTGSKVNTFTEGGTTVSQDIPGGTTYYVIISLDTNGNPTSDDLSGTLSITAT